MGDHAEMSHLDTSVTVGLDSMESDVKVSFHVLTVHSMSFRWKEMAFVISKLCRANKTMMMFAFDCFRARRFQSMIRHILK